MKIVMLGHTGVGKTTYIASMYGALQTPINGFSLKARDSDDATALQLLSDQISNGYFPTKTAVRKKYKFSLCFNRRPCFNFTWLDYRGGALREGSTSSDKAYLIQQLSAAHGVLVFIDSTATDNPQRRDEIGIMTNLLGRALANVESRMPVGLVFTKADLVDEVSDEAYELVDGLREAIAASSTLLGTIIPIACGPFPSLVEMPLLFLLRTSIISRHNSLVEKANEAMTKAAEHQNQANILNDIWCVFTDGLSERDRARLAAQAAQNHLRASKRLLKPAKRLNRYLESLTIF
jgi:GTPase SAR1 family protein